MKQIIIPEPLKVEIREMPMPEIGNEDQILVKTEFSGVSLGTEKIFFDGTWEKDLSKYPIYPGYEAVGIVEKCGKNVKKFVPGDRVITFGPHASYVLVNEGGALKVPGHVKPEKATLAILGATATHAVERGNIPYNSKVAIFGAGVVGCLILQHAKCAGAEFVMVCDINDEKLSVAKELGADLIVNPKHQSPSETLVSKIGELADVSYEVAGGNPSAQEEAVRSTREHGRVVMMGGGDRGIIRFSYRPFFSNEVTVVASRATGGPANFSKSMNSIITGKVRVEPIPTEIIPYTEIERIYHALVTGDYTFIHIVLKWF